MASSSSSQIGPGQPPNFAGKIWSCLPVFQRGEPYGWELRPDFELDIHCFLTPTNVGDVYALTVMTSDTFKDGTFQAQTIERLIKGESWVNDWNKLREELKFASYSNTRIWDPTRPESSEKDLAKKDCQVLLGRLRGFDSKLKTFDAEGQKLRMILGVNVDSSLSSPSNQQSNGTLPSLQNWEPDTQYLAEFV